MGKIVVTILRFAFYNYYFFVWLQNSPNLTVVISNARQQIRYNLFAYLQVALLTQLSHKNIVNLYAGRTHTHAQSSDSLSRALTILIAY